MTSTECEFYRVNRKMITVLGLRGDTLAVYALIASFSKGARGGFYGNYKHLAEWLGINERTVKDIIPKLMKARQKKKLPKSRKRLRRKRKTKK